MVGRPTLATDEFSEFLSQNEISYTLFQIECVLVFVKAHEAVTCPPIAI